MRSSVYSKRKEAWDERQRETQAAGLVAERFPGVASIVVTMEYSRGGFSAVRRTLNYFPGNHAFFKVSALGDECDEGGFDLTAFIHRMIGNRAKTAKGKFSCDHNKPVVVHPVVEYEVAITYS